MARSNVLTDAELLLEKKAAFIQASPLKKSEEAFSRDEYNPTDLLIRASISIPHRNPSCNKEMAGGAVRIHPLHPSLAGGRNKGNEKHNTIDNKAEDSHELEKSSSFYVEKDIVIESLLEALHLHRLRKKESDNYTLSHVTKLLHALSLEYKHRSVYDKAITCLNEALLLVQEEMKHLSDLQTDESKITKYQRVTSSFNSSTTPLSNLQSYVIPSTTIQLKSLLEEKSKLLSTLGNIFKAQKKMNDAIDSYADALLCLTNAGYPSESPPVSMVTRLIQRLQQPRPRDDQ